MFDDENEGCCELYLIKYQQYQLSSGKILLAPDEYLEKIRPNLIKLINDCKIKLTMNVIFNSTRNFNDKELYKLKQKQVMILMNYLAY